MISAPFCSSQAGLDLPFLQAQAMTRVVTKTENKTKPCSVVECQHPGRHPGSFMVPPIHPCVTNRPPASGLKTMPCATSQFWESTRATPVVLIARWWLGLVALVRWSRLLHSRVWCLGSGVWIICRRHYQIPCPRASLGFLGAWRSQNSWTSYMTAASTPYLRQQVPHS